MEPPVPRTSNHLPGAFLRNIATQEDHLISANKKVNNVIIVLIYIML